MGCQTTITVLVLSAFRIYYFFLWNNYYIGLPDKNYLALQLLRQIFNEVNTERTLKNIYVHQGTSVKLSKWTSSNVLGSRSHKHVLTPLRHIRQMYL